MDLQKNKKIKQEKGLLIPFSIFLFFYLLFLFFISLEDTMALLGVGKKY